MSLRGGALSPVSFESPQETAFPKPPRRWPVQLLSPSAQKFPPQWLRTRLPLTPSPRGPHVEQKAQHCVPALRQAWKQMLWESVRIESSAQCHCIHLPTSASIHGLSTTGRSTGSARAPSPGQQHRRKVVVPANKGIISLKKPRKFGRGFPAG